MDFVLIGLKSYPRNDMPTQTYELKEAGEIFSASQAKEVSAFLRSRDGSYPFLITRAGELLISHRLPDSSADTNRAFLATHRSLAEIYRIDRNQDPDVVFAGELKVVAGRVQSLIDRSGTFHFQVSQSNHRSDNEKLIQDNQVRLTFARGFLGNWGLWDSNAKIINFWRLNYREDPSLRSLDGHQTTKSLGEYELKCFHSPQCWAQFEILDAFIRALAEKGGASFLVRASIEKKISLSPEDFNLMAITEVARAGAIDFMANPAIQESPTVSNLVELIPRLSAELGF